MKIDDILLKKEKGKTWSNEEIDYVVKGFTNGKIDEESMSKFLRLIYEKDLSFKETLYLTNSMINTGEIIKFDNINKVVVDKHSTGGVGDKVTLIIGPLVAACGLAVAKMSGRSLGLTGGTIDKLESITGYNVNLSKEDFINQVNEIGISVISQTERIAVADKKIYALRDKIGTVDSIPLIASSIMSKKIASGADIIVIDLKVGNGAFMKNIKNAKRLAKTMKKIGNAWNKKVVVIMSDMNSPLGTNIGNSLEIKEVINFFDGIRDKRLERICLVIATYMVSLGKKINAKRAYQEVTEALNNKSAKRIFEEWIKRQNGDINKLKDDAKVLEIKSNKSGFVEYIDANKIAIICNLLGSGRNNKRSDIDYTVGIELTKGLYSKVIEGETIAKIYYNEEINDIENKVLDAIQINSIIKEKKDIIIDVIK